MIAGITAAGYFGIAVFALVWGGAIVIWLWVIFHPAKALRNLKDLSDDVFGIITPRNFNRMGEAKARKVYGDQAVDTYLWRVSYYGAKARRERE